MSFAKQPSLVGCKHSMVLRRVFRWFIRDTSAYNVYGGKLDEFTPLTLTR
ncbi:hypothetical protein [Paenibacillus phocaensis]|nr:hypothetical protein [Paenibacillus phocaensis]